MDHHTSFMWKKYLLEKGFDTLLKLLNTSMRKKCFFEFKNINQKKKLWNIFLWNTFSYLYVSNKIIAVWYTQCTTHVFGAIWWRGKKQKKSFCMQIYVTFGYLSSLTLLSDILYSHHWSVYEDKVVQVRHFIPAPVVRTSSSACLFKYPSIACQH